MNCTIVPKIFYMLWEERRKRPLKAVFHSIFRSDFSQAEPLWKAVSGSFQQTALKPTAVCIVLIFLFLKYNDGETYLRNRVWMSKCMLFIFVGKQPRADELISDGPWGRLCPRGISRGWAMRQLVLIQFFFIPTFHEHPREGTIMNFLC